MVSGLTGFAFGLVVSSIWFFIVTPPQTATLIIAFGLIGLVVWTGICDQPGMIYYSIFQ
jgi:hypothetical protein